MNVAFLVCAVVTAVSAFVSLAFSIAALSGASRETRTPSLYAAARSVALALVSLVPFLLHSRGWLEGVAAGMIVVQACDAGIGVVIGEPVKTWGPAATAVLNLAVLVWLVRG